MKCPKCQHENPEDARFCNGCGDKLELSCPECGKANPPGSRFCNGCGHNLTTPSERVVKDLSFDEKLDKIQRYLPEGLTEKILSQRDRIEGERKHVTVMFCDMEGFTSLSERLGPEEAYDIVDQIYELLIHKVHDYEGTVNEMTGDGIMALFGAPIALEDAPQRAIRSALAIHREMAKSSDRIKQETEGIPPLKMRVGIHTGPVVVGTVGNNLRVEFKAVGDTVNLASRMEGLAEPGATYVTEDTFKLTQGLFRFEALGQKEVKGKKEPVKVYRVIAPSTRKTRFDVSAERGLTPFVGRERELELLLDVFKRAKSGRGQAISIISEAGVGKSRLLYEFRKAVANENANFLEGKCLSYSRGVAYHPVIDSLKANFDITESDRDLEIKEKVKRGLKILRADEASTLPYLLELFSVKESTIEKIPLSPEARKDRIMEAVKRITLEGSEIRPLILAYEDLHWVDKSSEDVLKYVLESIPGARVLMIFTYRPEFVHTWGGKSYHSQLNLNRLSNRESLAMATHLLGTEEIESSLEEFILEKTDGIPFFIEEFLKSLRDLRIIEIKDNTYRIAKDIQTLTIPATIQDVIMARVDSLPERAKGVLQTGSVVGREFSHDLINRVMALPEQELLSHLSALKESELLYERGIYPQSTYIFKHALTQEVAYNSLLQKRRRDIHEKIGQAIEQIYSERLEEFYEMLAYHYMKGENSDKAYQYLTLSGEKAARNYANNESFRFYSEAIEVLSLMPDTVENKRKQIEVRLLMATSMASMGFPEGILQIFKDGEKISEEIGDERSLAIFHSWLGNYYSVKGDPLSGMRYSEKSFQAAEKIEDVDLMAPFGYTLCVSYFASGISLQTVDVASKVIKVLEKTSRQSEFFGKPFNVYVLMHGFSVFMLAHLGKFDEGEALCKKALSFAQSIDHLPSLGFAEMSCGIRNMIRADGRSAVKYLENSLKHMQEGNVHHLLPLVFLHLGQGHLLLGELETARNHLQKGLKILKDVGLSYFISGFYCGLSMVHLDSGELESAQSFAEKALNTAQKNKEKHYEGRSWTDLGRILGKKGTEQNDKVQTKEAEAHILKGIRILEELKNQPYVCRGYLWLGELYADMGLEEKALENLKTAEAMFKEMGMDYYLAKTQEVLKKV